MIIITIINKNEELMQKGKTVFQLLKKSSYFSRLKIESQAR